MWHPDVLSTLLAPGSPVSGPGRAGRGSYPLSFTEGAEPWPDAGTHMGQTWGLLRSGSQVKGEQIRLPSLMASPAADLEVQERQCCLQVYVLRSSGQGGLSIVYAVRAAG